MLRNFYIFFILSLFITINNKAQTSCKQQLKQAEDFFNTGEFENCIQLLNTSLKNCSYSKKEQEVIYELLVKSNIETDNLLEVDNNTIKLFKTNPFYELKEDNNSEDFNRHIKKYSVLPMLSVGLRNTVLKPNFKTTKVFSVLLDDVNYATPYTTTKTLLLYYGWIEYQFKKNFSINAEFTGLNIEYSRNFSKTNWEMNFNEKMKFFEFPLYLKKYFLTTKTIFPYASAGLSYLRLIKSRGNAQISYSNESYLTGSQILTTSVQNDIDLLSMRSKNNFLLLLGAGVGFKFKNFGLYIDVRYYKGTNNLTKTSNRFSNSMLINDYFYIDNSVILNKFEGGISISYTLKNLIKKNKY